VYETRFIDGAFRPFIQFTEHLYLQNAAMRGLLEQVPGLDWKEAVGHHVAKGNSDTAKFETLYAALGNVRSQESLIDRLYEALQEFLSIKQSL
jgi:hypothetical protein